MSKATTYQKLPLDQLQPNPFQPRDKIKKEGLEELVQSIKMHGVLEPLVVAQTPAGFQIIAGERRWRASKEAGLDVVPVIIRRTTPRKMLEMAIVENVQRVDLNPIEQLWRVIKEDHFSLFATKDHDFLDDYLCSILKYYSYNKPLVSSTNG